MKGNSEDYDRLAFDQLRAARNARSTKDRLHHEQQAHAFALAAHQLSREAELTESKKRSTGVLGLLAEPPMQN
jgi:hypothetical protein